MAQPIVDELLILVRDLRDHGAALEAESARRRAPRTTVEIAPV